MSTEPQKPLLIAEFRQQLADRYATAKAAVHCSHETPPDWLWHLANLQARLLELRAASQVGEATQLLTLARQTDWDTLIDEWEPRVGLYQFEIRRRARRLIQNLLKPYVLYTDVIACQAEMGMLDSALYASPCLQALADEQVRQAWRREIDKTRHRRRAIRAIEPIGSLQDLRLTVLVKVQHGNDLEHCHAPYLAGERVSWDVEPRVLAVGVREPHAELQEVTAVSPLPDCKLAVTFENGDRRLFDMTPYLDKGVFKCLKDAHLFQQAYVDLGTVCWPGNIDIAPETLHANGAPLDLTYVLHQDGDQFVATCLEMEVSSDGVTPDSAVAALEEAVVHHQGVTGKITLRPAFPERELPTDILATVAASRAWRLEHPAQQTNLEALERQLFQAGKAKAIDLAQRCRTELDHSITKIGLPLAQLGDGQDLSPDAAEIVDVLVGRLRRYQDALRQMLTVVWWHSDATPALGVLVSERLVADKLPEARQEVILDALCHASRLTDFRSRPGLRARLEGVSLAASYLRQLHDQWLQQLKQRRGL